jgi:hypothetical protein
VALSNIENQIHYVTNFHDFVSTPFSGNTNAICWTRELIGDFSEIVAKIELKENIITIELEQLRKLELSEQGQMAREIILNDMKLLEAHGSSPILNVIKNYERDDDNPFFPTDVYSFHVDQSPIACDTFLCTYYGESSEILPNEQGEKKVLISEIRAELKKQFEGTEEEFETFLSENFLDLHYKAKPGVLPIKLGVGNLWRLATAGPESIVPPCLHRAPVEKTGEHRLLLIC